MRTPENIISPLLMVIGLVFCLFSVKVGLGRVKDPGPGLIPFVSGCVLIGLSLCTMLFEAKPGGEKDGKARPDKIGVRLGLPVLVLICLLIYALLMETLGFLMSTFFFLTFLFKMSEKRSWKVALAASILTTASSYALFGYLLEVGLPEGFLGF